MNKICKLLLKLMHATKIVSELRPIKWYDRIIIYLCKQVYIVIRDNIRVKGK